MKKNGHEVELNEKNKYLIDTYQKTFIAIAYKKILCVKILVIIFAFENRLKILIKISSILNKYDYFLNIY